MRGFANPSLGSGQVEPDLETSSIVSPLEGKHMF
jgi:hypothetical protein